MLWFYKESFNALLSGDTLQPGSLPRAGGLHNGRLPLIRDHRAWQFPNFPPPGIPPCSRRWFWSCDPSHTPSSSYWGSNQRGAMMVPTPTPGCPAEHATLATTVSRNLPSHKSQRPLLKPSLASAGMTKVWGEGAMCVCKYGGWRVASPSYVHCCNAICSSSRI